MAEEQQNIKAAGIGVDPNAIAFRPTSWEQLINFSNMLAKTTFVPKDFHENGGAVLAAIQYGHEVGLPPMASLQAICVINGRPSVYGDGYWAIICSHPLYEWSKELPPHEASEKGYGECTIKRRGDPEPKTRRYTLEMAKTYKLLDKDNWQKQPGVMLMWRARHLAGSAAIPEATKGLIPASIARDIDIEPGDVRSEVEPVIAIEPPQIKNAKKQENKDALKQSAPATKAITVQKTQPTQEQGRQENEPQTTQENTPPNGESQPQKKQKEVTREASEASKTHNLATEGSTPSPASKLWLDESLPMRDRVADWIRNADQDDLNSRPNFLSANLYRLDIDDQVALCKEFDARRRQ